MLAAKGSNGADQPGRRRDGADHHRAGHADAATGRSTRSPSQATSESTLDAAEAEVTQILEERHKVKDTSEPGFSVLNQGSLLETSSSTSSVFTTLLGEVAAISLLVGGIGVMNIMLVSVTERTREIGIRKAIGARRGDILTQFLTEAVLVSLFGGLLGVALGVVGSQFEIAGVIPRSRPTRSSSPSAPPPSRACSSAPIPRPRRPPATDRGAPL